MRVVCRALLPAGGGTGAAAGDCGGLLLRCWHPAAAAPGRGRAWRAAAMGSPGGDADHATRRRRQRGSSPPAAGADAAAAAAALEAASTRDGPAVVRPAAAGGEGRRRVPVAGAGTAVGASPCLGPPAPGSGGAGGGDKSPPPAWADLLHPVACDGAGALTAGEADGRWRGSLGSDANGRAAPGEGGPCPTVFGGSAPTVTAGAAKAPAAAAEAALELDASSEAATLPPAAPDAATVREAVKDTPTGLDAAAAAVTGPGAARVVATEPDMVPEAASESDSATVAATVPEAATAVGPGHDAATEVEHFPESATEVASARGGASDVATVPAAATGASSVPDAVVYPAAVSNAVTSLVPDAATEAAIVPDAAKEASFESKPATETVSGLGAAADAVTVPVTAVAAATGPRAATQPATEPEAVTRVPTVPGTARETACGPGAASEAASRPSAATEAAFVPTVPVEHEVGREAAPGTDAPTKAVTGPLAAASEAKSEPVAAREAPPGPDTATRAATVPVAETRAAIRPGVAGEAATRRDEATEAAADPDARTKATNGPVAARKAGSGPVHHVRQPSFDLGNFAADVSPILASKAAVDANSCPPSDAPPPTAVAAATALFDHPLLAPTRRQVTGEAGSGPPADEVAVAPAASSGSTPASDGAVDSVTPGGGAGKKVKKKKSPPKYLLNFPESAEAALRGMDDDGIRRVQARQSPGLYALAMVLTTLTAVETALAVPGMLFALGYDSAASWLTASLVCLGILSQLPKKLIWRRRPWMSGRAVGLRRDSTSSFPSRAVVCAVVFPIVSLRAYAAEAAYRTAAASYVTAGSGILAAGRQAELAAAATALAAATSAADAHARGWGPAALLWRLSPSGSTSAVHTLSSLSLISSFVLLTAWSRVHVGAHYPSDAGAGALFGALISSVGSWAHDLWGRSGCATATGACYYAPHAVNLTSETVWARLPYRGLGIAIAVSYGVTLASFKGFWVKCSYVYGLLFSCVTLRWVLLCPVGGTAAAPAAALPPLPVQTVGGHVVVVAVFGALLAFGMATRGLRGMFRLVNFTVTYFGSLVFIVAWRLRHAAPEMGGPTVRAVAEAVVRQGTAPA